MNQKKLLQSLLFLAECQQFSKEITSATVLVWDRLMAPDKVTDSEFEEAAFRLIRRQPEFPAPCQILAIVAEIRRERPLPEFGDSDCLPLPSSAPALGDRSVEEVRRHTLAGFAKKAAMPGSNQLDPEHQKRIRDQIVIIRGASR